MQAQVSIIIVNYNGGQLVDKCVASIEQNPPSVSYEVLIIDNDSSDNSATGLNNYRNTQVYKTGENLGLAKAFNIGVRKSQGTTVISLDNDTVIQPHSLDRLVQTFDQYPKVGCAGSKVVNPDMSAQMTARRRPSAINALFGRRSLITKIFPNNPLSKRYLLETTEIGDQPFQVDWVSTAALAVKREVIDQVGALDEGFFVYWVDADWCERIKRAGWDIVSVPQSVIIHDENLKSNRREKKSTRMVLDFHNGAYRYYSRNHCHHRLSPKRPIAWICLKARAYAIVLIDEIGWHLQRLRPSLKTVNR